jgi:hypothetical protein
VTVEIVLLPDPSMMTWKDWVDTVAGFNPELLDWTNPNNDWIPFARQLCEAVTAAPQPDLFRSWQDWALALKQALQI